VVIPDSVISIDSYAFYGCSGLPDVAIPAGVTFIGSYAFYRCTGLSAISVAGGNAAYASLDGVLFNQSLTSLIQYPGGKAGAYIVPEGVLAIGSYAFSGNTGLTDVAISDSVTTLGTYAFYNCTGLANVTLGAGVTSIGSGGFYGCSGLSSVAIPAGVISIGSTAFYGCSGLVGISVDGGNPAYAGVDGVLFDQTVTTLIQCPGAKAGAYAVPESVVSIGSLAFSGCAGLTQLVLSEGLERIGASAFSGCTNIPIAVVPRSVIQIGAAAFNGLAEGLYFKGNIPVFEQYNPNWPLLHYCLGTTGWELYRSPKCVWTSVVTFDAGAGLPSYSSQTGNVANAYGTLPNASRADYSFGGWWTEADGHGFHAFPGTLVPYVTTPHVLYARWTGRPPIGGENEVRFLSDRMSFDLPTGYSDCTVEYATAINNQSWNFAPLPAGEYSVSDGIVTVYYSSDRPKAVYRAQFNP
jgi:hypothetical protein